MLRLVGAASGQGSTGLPKRNVARMAPRIVGSPAAGAAERGPSDAAKRAALDLELEVARENRQASSIDALDGRWVFACRVATSIEGGRAAILRPEARERLLAQANRLGLRPFDANLIIAIVQDSARCGHEPLGLPTAERVPLVRPAHPPQPSSLPVPARMAIAAVVGIVLAAIMVQWVVS